MPKVRKGSAYEKRYSEDQIQKALSAIRIGSMSNREAARKFKIPRSTLIFRLSNNFVKTAPGPPPVLGHDGEAELVKWISECAKKGIPRTKEDVQARVKQYLEENNLKNPFTQNMPGDGWYKSFLKRNPSLCEKFPEEVQKGFQEEVQGGFQEEVQEEVQEDFQEGEGYVTETDIRKRFKEIQDYLTKKNYLEILNDPTRLFNSDETHFMVCPKMKNVLAVRGTSNGIEKDNAKLNLTVLVTFSASGVTIPPMIVYPYESLPEPVGRSVPSGWGVGVTQSGWMSDELFIEYLKNIFHPYLLQNEIKLPVLLFIDGHKNRVSLQVSKVCADLQVILTCLYSNSTRMLQPTDGEFKTLKNVYKNCLMECRTENPGHAIALEQMAPILKKAVDKFSDSKAIINAFRACGLYPWDSNAFDYMNCLADPNKNPEQTALNTVVMTYHTFTKIVGEDLLKELESFNYQADRTKEFSVLHDLFKHFKNN